MNYSPLLKPAGRLFVTSILFVCLLIGTSFSVMGVAFDDVSSRNLPGTNDTSIDQKKDAPAGVVVSGNPSVLRLSDPWWSYLPFVKYEPDICTDFFLRARGNDVKDLQITSTGLGQARLTLKEPGNSVGESPNQSAKLSLTIPQTGQKEQQIGLCLPGKSLVSEPGTSAEGKILILEGRDKSLEVPLKIEYPAVPPLYTAVQWFLGIAIPALLGFLGAWGLTELNNSRSERAKEEKRFERFKQRRYVTLQDFFTVYYKTLPQPEREFAIQLRNDLLTRQYWEYIPSRKQLALENAIKSFAQAEIRRMLAELFPDWGEAIDGSAPNQTRRASMRKKLAHLIIDLKQAARNFVSDRQT